MCACVLQVCVGEMGGSCCREKSSHVEILDVRDSGLEGGVLFKKSERGHCLADLRKNFIR